MKVTFVSAAALAWTVGTAVAQTATPAAATTPAPAAAAAPATFTTYTAPGIMMGAWMNTAPGLDTPVAINQRLGFNLSLIHLSENLPIDFSEPPPTQLLDYTYTNAILYLSVYPSTTPDNVTDSQISDLAKQLGGYTTNGRPVILRLGAEMNGNWQPYGQLPVAFRALWQRVWTAVRAIPSNVPPATGAGGVSFLWAPNPQGNG
ncbi:hypothetical protein HKX48_007528 [Thoreauomyces humboldtii]|nr:hypothetical protein HKX48_007528 [Thoreauomyces humboldtii]